MWRSFDVGAVVESLPVPGARVVAGAGGTHRRVRRARLATTTDHLRQGGDGELVVTAAATLVAAADACADLAGELDGSKVSGLAVRLEPGDRLPAELLAAADRVALPVVTFPDGCTLDDVVAAVIDALLDAQANAVAEGQERFAALSLEALISGHGGGIADVAERATSFGWDLGRPRAVLLASIDPPTIPDDPQRALSTIAAAARATLGSDAIVWSRSSTIAALVAPATDAPDERRRIAEALRRELDERVTSVTVSIGVGRRVADPTDLPRSFLEASRAVDVGRWAKGRHVTEVFDELGLERLLASAPADDLAGFVEHAIGRLIDHDRASDSDLVETLEVWLETRNMAEAARRTHVHYNTFKNRLERIETILGPVTTDAARSLECAVAIYVARHYDGPWSAGPEPA